MVSTSKYIRYLKEQEIKEKRRLEKEAAEKRRKEEIYRLAKERKLERALTEALEKKLEEKEKKLEEKLYRLERSRREREPRRQLRLKEKTKLLETKHTGITKTTEFIFTEEEKEKCIKKSLDELTDEISGSKLVCPPGKELKKEISPRELTADLICFRKRVRKKSPEEIVAMYDKLLEADPERLCKKIEKRKNKDNK